MVTEGRNSNRVMWGYGGVKGSRILPILHGRYYIGLHPFIQ
jgi:hypothetical protein